MKSLSVILVVVLALMVTGGGVSAQPSPPPLSPESTNLIRAYPELNGAQAVGAGLVITGVEQFGCASGQLKIGLAVVITDPSQPYVLRTVVRVGYNIIVNDRQSWIIPSGHYTRTIVNSSSGGFINGTMPLATGTPFTVEFLFSQANGKPLWYSQIVISDCLSSSPTSGEINKAVLILNKNPTLQPNPADPTRAQKWVPTGKVAYSCAPSGVCTEKLTGKAGKIAKIRQTGRLKSALAAGTRVGIVVIADTSLLVSGSAYMNVILTDTGSANTQGYSLAFYSDAPLFPTNEVVYLPMVTPLVVPLNYIAAELLLEDLFLGGTAAGKLKVTSIYVYSVTP